jgi:hypothetical protein
VILDRELDSEVLNSLWIQFMNLVEQLHRCLDKIRKFWHLWVDNIQSCMHLGHICFCLTSFDRDSNWSESEPNGFVTLSMGT